jgi:hypothetical protein
MCIRKMKIRISVLLFVLLNVAQAIEAADTPSPELEEFLFMHPLFTRTSDQEHFQLTNDGKKMLENCARNFPNKQVIIITKSGMEAHIIMGAMNILNFQNIQLIDNIKHYFFTRPLK